MTPKSLSLSFRIPLAFHCLNNEGASGNVMEPRRITIQEDEYDGISGEMMRRHVLENFIRLCVERDLPLTDQARGLAPERSKEALKDWMKAANINPLAPADYNAATLNLLEKCTLSDIGGYLIPLQKANDKMEGTLKRDSCFECGWLITENPAIVDFTQGVSYNADPTKNNLFTQNMRVGVYSGVFRFDLGRVGVSDWAWLSSGATAQALDDTQRKNRIAALLDALEQWLLSPSGARQAGWLQHQSEMRDGIFCLSESGPAPFISPLSLDLRETKPAGEKPVFHNPDYQQKLQDLADARRGKAGRELECHSFDSMAELSRAFDAVRTAVGLDND